MRIRRGALAATLAPLLCGAVAALVVAAVPHPPGRPAQAPVTVGCLGQRQVRPGRLILACADGNAYLAGLHWSLWRGAAHGTGTWQVNDCAPSCATGHFHGFPAQVTLSRPEPLPRHRGVRYYSRITMTLTGPRCYTVDGERSCYPARYTGDLWGQTVGGLPVQGQTPDVPPVQGRPTGPPPVHGRATGAPPAIS